MKINKNSVTLKGEEILRLFILLTPLNITTTEVQYFEYQKALKLLHELKQELEEHLERKARWWNDMQLILKNISALRIKRKETIIDMAENLKMSVVRLSAIENGKIEMPDDFLEKLFTTYDFTLKEKADFVTKRLKINNKDLMEYMNRNN